MLQLGKSFRPGHIRTKCLLTGLTEFGGAWVAQPVEHHDPEIKPHVGHGACFRFCLPLSVPLSCSSVRMREQSPFL